jgi:hypothetical protein
MLNEAEILPLNSKLFEHFHKKDIKEITDEQFDSIIEESKKNKKYPIIYLYNKKDLVASLPFNLLASISEYSQKLEFYTLKPNQDTLNKLNNPELPSISMIVHETIKTYRSFNLNKANYFNLIDRIENLISDVVFKKNTNDYYKNKLNPKRNFVYLNDSNSLYNDCVYKGGHCAFVILDGEYDKEVGNTNLDYKKYSTIINELDLNNYPQYSTFYLVNGTCHTELMSSFQINLKKLPSLIIYDSKFQMFTKMKGEFYLDRVGEFMTDAVESRALYRKLNRENVHFVNTDCRKVVKKVARRDYEIEERIRQGYDEEDEYEEQNIGDEL